MIYANAINAVLVVSCSAVLVQSWRMDRRMKTFREVQLAEGVNQIERATMQARRVLSDLKQLLATEGMAQSNVLASAEAMREELSMMVGIGNSVAERIMDAASIANGTKTAEAAPKRRRRVTKAKTAEVETLEATNEETAKTAKTTKTRTTRRRSPARKAVTAKSAAPRLVGQAKVASDAAREAANLAETAAETAATDVAKALLAAIENSNSDGKVVALPAGRPRRKAAAA